MSFALVCGIVFFSTRVPPRREAKFHFCPSARLINVNHISKIEVEYAVLSANKKMSQLKLDQVATTPEAVRVYRIYIGEERIKVVATEGDPGSKVLDDIYNEACGPGQSVNPPASVSI